MNADSRGRRVVELRTLLAITQKELSDLTGIAQANLSKIERGTTALSDSAAHRIAAATGTPIEFFDQVAKAVPGGAVNYRRTGSVSAKGEKFLLQSLTEVARIAIDLSNAPSGVKRTPLPIARADASVNASLIEELAAQVRECAGIDPDAPIRNVVRMAERAGIAVAAVKPPEDAESILKGHMGLSATVGRAVIIYVSGESGDRQRFTVAHEFGHIVLHTNRQVPIELRESEAHDFAGALLLPEIVARRELSESLTLEGYLRVKAKFGISVQAAIMRARKLRIISRDRQRSLMIQVSGRGWRKNEPVTVTTESPMLMWTELTARFGPAPYLKACGELGVRASDLQTWIPDRTRRPRKSAVDANETATVIDMFSRT